MRLSFQKNLLLSIKKNFEIRGKSKKEQLPCEQFLQQIEISRIFLRAKQAVEEKRGRFQFVVEIAHKAVVLILISL